MRCPGCGSYMGDHSRFCAVCGNDRYARQTKKNKINIPIVRPSQESVHQYHPGAKKSAGLGKTPNAKKTKSYSQSIATAPGSGSPDYGKQPGYSSSNHTYSQSTEVGANPYYAKEKAGKPGKSGKPDKGLGIFNKGWIVFNKAKLIIYAVAAIIFLISVIAPQIYDDNSTDDYKDPNADYGFETKDPALAQEDDGKFSAEVYEYSYDSIAMKVDWTAYWGSLFMGEGENKNMFSNWVSGALDDYYVEETSDSYFDVYSDIVVSVISSEIFDSDAITIVGDWSQLETKTANIYYGQYTVGTDLEIVGTIFIAFSPNYEYFASFYSLRGTADGCENFDIEYSLPILQSLLFYYDVVRYDDSTDTNSEAA